MTNERAAGVTGTTSNHVSTLSSPGRSIELYFQCAVVVIGLVGTAANALILYAMVASRQHKKQLLIFHQNVLDFVSSLLMVVTYSVKLRNIYLTGLGGYWLCMLIVSENITWCVILASKTNIIFVTIDRYLKVVYPVYSKQKLRNWMLYSVMTFAWISGTVHVFALTFTTSAVIDGVCYAYVIWKSRQSQMAYGIFYFLWLYVIPLIILILCYWRILIAVRRQARVMAGHAVAGPRTAQVMSHQMQSNVIKTMILVSAFYAASDLPGQIYYLQLNIHANLTLLDNGYYAILFISFFYFCTNPFIYATKFDPVKRVLLSLISRDKSSVQPVENIELAGTLIPQSLN